MRPGKRQRQPRQGWPTPARRRSAPVWTEGPADRTCDGAPELLQIRVEQLRRAVRVPIEHEMRSLAVLWLEYRSLGRLLP